MSTTPEPTKRSFLTRLWSNWLTLLGAVTVVLTLAAVAVIALVGGTDNPYAAGAILIVVPVMLAVGLILVPIGLRVEKRRHVASPEDPVAEAFELAVKSRRARWHIGFVLVATMSIILLLSMGGSAALHYMDSPGFCGASCHVMEPEWSAYAHAPHSEVACVRCHVGPGAVGEAHAKLNGTRQLWGVMSGRYDRPIATGAVIPQSTATCEGCHARARWVGNRLQTYPKYKGDEGNTPVWSAQVLHIGGKDPITGKWSGIHSHLRAGRVIRFETLDPERRKIGKITVEDEGKVTAEYVPSKAGGAALATRTMECIDCHNRPAHRFDGTARQAVDKAIADGRLDAKLPWIEAAATEVLPKPSIAHDRADGAFFTKMLGDAYAAHGWKRPADADLAKAGATLSTIYARNVFPDERVGFGTYPDNQGHYSDGDDSVGCFRCHDKDHSSKLGGVEKTLGQDCDMCHETLAAEENPAKFDDTLKPILGM